MIDTSIIEFKFKQKNERVSWEDLPVIQRCYSSDIDKTIDLIKETFQCIEIRWNYQGNYQGHYFKGNTSRFGLITRNK